MRGHLLPVTIESRNGCHREWEESIILMNVQQMKGLSKGIVDVWEVFALSKMPYLSIVFILWSLPSIPQLRELEHQHAEAKSVKTLQGLLSASCPF